jgi:hypothetical protein
MQTKRAVSARFLMERKKAARQPENGKPALRLSDKGATRPQNGQLKMQRQPETAAKRFQAALTGRMKPPTIRALFVKPSSST